MSDLEKQEHVLPERSTAIILDTVLLVPREVLLQIGIEGVLICL